jgi:hypothetical protein
MENNVPLLIDVAKEVRRIYLGCSLVDRDLWGLSLLDLMADNISDVSLADLKAAIVAAGIYPIANDRIQSEIATYR